MLMRVFFDSLDLQAILRYNYRMETEAETVNNMVIVSFADIGYSPIGRVWMQGVFGRNER